MNKVQLIQRVAKEARVKKSQASRSVKALVKTIREALRVGDKTIHPRVVATLRKRRRVDAPLIRVRATLRYGHVRWTRQRWPRCALLCDVGGRRTAALLVLAPGPARTLLVAPNFGHWGGFCDI